MPTPTTLTDDELSALCIQASRTAKHNLTDYSARVVSRVITPFQATRELPAGFRQWRAELWNDTDNALITSSEWDLSRSWACALCESLLMEQEEKMETEALEEARKELEQ